MLLALLVTIPILTQDGVHGEFDAQFRQNSVYINVEVRTGRGTSNWGRTYPLSDLSEVKRSGKDIGFKLVHEAGVVTFKGEQDGSRAEGAFMFMPSKSYVQQLDKMGYNGLTDERIFALAMADLWVADIRFLELNTSDQLSITQIVRMANHGVSPEYVKAVGEAGYRNLDSDDLVRARDHGVTAQFIGEMKDLGFRPSLEDLIRIRDHGVDGDYVREIVALGFEKMSVSGYVRLRDHGVTSDYAQEVQQLYKEIDAEQLIQLRDHGVSPSFIRRMNREYGKKLELRQLVRLRDMGDG